MFNPYQDRLLFNEDLHNAYKETSAKSRVPIPNFLTKYNPFNKKKVHDTGSFNKHYRPRKESKRDKERVMLPANFKKQKHPMPDFSLLSEKQQVFWAKCVSSPNAPLTLLDHVKVRFDEDDELNDFFEKQISEKINKAKTEFDELDLDVFREARNRTNPYELIKNSVFQNRAAVKMANVSKITGICDISFLPEEKKVIYFADICAGPGGFTEYMYWRYKTSGCKGWGFTLRGKDDFKIDRFNPEAICDNFECTYGKDGTGDIFKNDNIFNLANRIDEGTGGRGVAIVMADGGFPIHGEYNKQEVITKQIILCQFLTAMFILRKGGNFMCKVFDMYTTFSTDLFYILSQCFEYVAIIKPFTSRVANSERYVVCKNLLMRRPKICELLFRVNNEINMKKNVVSLIDPDHIQKNVVFKDFLTKSINRLGERQLYYLSAIKKAVEDDDYGFRDISFELAQKCLTEWGLPFDQHLLQQRRPSGFLSKRGIARGRRYQSMGRRDRFQDDDEFKDETDVWEKKEDISKFLPEPVMVGKRRRDPFYGGEKKMKYNEEEEKKGKKKEDEFSNALFGGGLEIDELEKQFQGK